MEAFRSLMEWAAFAFNALAVAVIVVGTIVAAVRSGLLRSLVSSNRPGAVSRFKHQMVGSLLIGLDLLVASDVIHTAAIEPTLYGVATLGLLVVVRILLTWSLVVEIEGRWPWQRPSALSEDDADSR